MSDGAEQMDLLDAPSAIPAKCKGCGFLWAGRDAIGALSLDGCLCFWCGGELVPFFALKAGWPGGEPKGPRAAAARRRRTHAAGFGKSATYPVEIPGPHGEPRS